MKTEHNSSLGNTQIQSLGNTQIQSLENTQIQSLENTQIQSFGKYTKKYDLIFIVWGLFLVPSVKGTLVTIEHDTKYKVPKI